MWVKQQDRRQCGKLLSHNSSGIEQMMLCVANENFFPLITTVSRAVFDSPSVSGLLGDMACMLLHYCTMHNSQFK